MIRAVQSARSGPTSSMSRRSFKLFWNLHKWIGLAAAIIIIMIAATGFLLLIKKDFAWLQPPTQAGAPITTPADFITTDQVIAAAIDHGHPDITSLDDIDRIDFRPSKRIHKVRSRHNHTEIQIDAVTGTVLGVSPRRSDLIESIHDGSFFGDWVHDYLMPIVAIALLGLVGTGFWVWLEPKLHRWKRRRHP